MAIVVLKNMRVRDILSDKDYAEVQAIPVPYNYINENPWIQEEIEKMVDWMQECKGMPWDVIENTEVQSENKRIHKNYVKVGSDVRKSRKNGYVRVIYKGVYRDVPRHALISNGRSNLLHKNYVEEVKNA